MALGVKSVCIRPFLLVNVVLLSVLLLLVHHHSTVKLLARNIQELDSAPFDEDASRYFQVCHKDESVLRGNVQFDKFKEKLEDYAVFHREQVQLLERGGESAGVHTLTWYCPDNTLCSGLGDQLYRIQLTFLLAVASRRAFFIHWDQVSMETMKYLQPRAIQWDRFDGSKHSDLKRGSCCFLKNKLYSEDHTHLALLDEGLFVPLNRGVKMMCARNYRTRKLLEEMGVLANDTLQFSVSLNYLQSVLLQYLFKFREEVVATVDEIQESVGLDKPYVGVHMRTGFLGNEFEETKKIKNPLKYVEAEMLWVSTLNCSVELADSVTGQDSLLYLATDSSKVKKMAQEMFPRRIVMLDIKVQHVAMAKTHGNPKLKGSKQINKEFYNSESGMDGALGTWVDFLLLARSHAIVYPFSGFSNTAASYGYIPDSRIHHVPNCELQKDNQSAFIAYDT